MNEPQDESHTQHQSEEPEWPTHCEYCETALESGVLDVIPNADSEHLQTGSPATVIAQDFCPNLDCPGKNADVAKGTAPGGRP